MFALRLFRYLYSRVVTISSLRFAQPDSLHIQKVGVLFNHKYRFYGVIISFLLSIGAIATLLSVSHAELDRESRLGIPLLGLDTPTPTPLLPTPTQPFPTNIIVEEILLETDGPVCGEGFNVAVLVRISGPVGSVGSANIVLQDTSNGAVEQLMINSFRDLPSDQYLRVYFRVTSYANPDSEHTLYAVADPDNRIAERSELDNQTALTYWLKPGQCTTGP